MTSAYIGQMGCTPLAGASTRCLPESEDDELETTGRFHVHAICHAVGLGSCMPESSAIEIALIDTIGF